LNAASAASYATRGPVHEFDFGSSIDVSPLTWIPPERLVIIVGNYGSGKTEVSVNLAVGLAKSGKRVQIADLDIVNPYFRSREARATMEACGIRVVIPPGDQAFADLPIVVPQIKAMLEPQGDDFSIFDVGGDDVGARMLSSFVEALGEQPYALLQVINSRRPFTGTVAGCLEMGRMIEAASRLKVTGYIVNTHLIEQTTEDVIIEGVELAKEVSKVSGVPVEVVAAMAELAESPRVLGLGIKVLKLERIMLPPWLRGGAKDDNADVREEPLPAARAKPIFRP
jgi:hypothetical protein